MLAALIAQYGLLAVFLGSAIEGETVAFLGGVSAHRHLLPFWAVACAAALGSFLADQIFFFLGRWASASPRIARLAEKPIAAKVKALLERHPTTFILSFRFLYGMRTISPIIIGLSGVPARTFVVLNAIAAAVWGLVIPAVGYFFSDLVESLVGRLHLHVHLLIGLLVVAALAGALTLWGRRRLMRDEDR